MGSDVFTTKCEAHNYVVPYRSSCPVCVSAKRSQLHAANLAHMPRYLFEQQLDVKSTPQGMPVHSYVKNPCKDIQLSSDMSKFDACAVRWKVSYKSNCIDQAYTKLASTTQAFVMALDGATDARVLRLRREYQDQIDSGDTSPNEQDRLLENLAIDMYYEIVRVSNSRVEEPSRVMGQFVAYFKLLYCSGQRLIVDETTSIPAEYVLNFNSLNTNIGLCTTTCALLRELDKYEGDVGKYRIYHEKLIANTKGDAIKQHAVKIMAEDLWAVLPMDNNVRNFMKIRNQFLATVEQLYFRGQRLVELQTPVPVTVRHAKPEFKHSYADDVYDYIMTSNKELYHQQCLLETKLEASNFSTRPSLVTAFRRFARDACESYTKHKMPNYNSLDNGHVYTLQTILADKYLEGIRR